MKKFVVISLLCFALSVSACSSTDQTSSELSGSELTHDITNTEQYALSIPEQWVVAEEPGGVLRFKKDDEDIGGLNIVDYHPEQPLSQLNPNHAEVTKENELSGYFTTVVQFDYKITPPAASGDQTVTQEVHYNFLVQEQNIAYQLYFNAEVVEEETALQIIHTFKLRE
ncbi:hypothetical protein [Caldalkalibacillus salinus]|uniref:hypothetical protein n=1 Tax=Caldalkalibacillus salinus TaxID=2803787 RepID=UPI001922544C|nr:hypothetical protein [Caldalkalibacillus salinus]